MHTGVSKRRLIVTCLENVMQVMIIKIALLTQNNVTMAEKNTQKITFAHACM